uniref:Complex 1 LYR protein domain-containing protein n=1 Tax=Paulinella micropora TaxID=1928728 RepID=A0A2Z6ERX9_9EUKA|nr:hypothetical protein [Paulinella micropora]
MSATRVELLGLYRQLLRHAKRYPSVKRDGLYQTIRLEWRENAKLSDVKSREFQIRSATFGLHKLKEMTDLDPNATAWTVNMDPQKAATSRPRMESLLADFDTTAEEEEQADGPMEENVPPEDMGHVDQMMKIQELDQQMRKNRKR